MILVDTSVWIDFFLGTGSPHHLALHELIEDGEEVCLAGIILAEILQGIKSDRQFTMTRDRLLDFPIYSAGSPASFIEAARIYRLCRKSGFTPRGIADCIITAIAIEHGLLLFHKDRDFDAIAGIVADLRVLIIQS